MTVNTAQNHLIDLHRAIPGVNQVLVLGQIRRCNGKAAVAQIIIGQVAKAAADRTGNVGCQRADSRRESVMYSSGFVTSGSVTSGSVGSTGSISEL